MRMDQLTVGEEYAYQDGRGSTVHQIRVDALRQHRMIRNPNPWSYTKVPSQVKDGVKVTFLCDHDCYLSRQEDDQIVQVRGILYTWADHLLHVKANEEAAARRRMELSDREARIIRALDVMGVEYVKARASIEVQQRYALSIDELEQVAATITELRNRNQR